MIENKGQLLDLDVEDVNKNIKLFQDNYPSKALPPTYEELLFDIEKTIYSSKGKTIKEKKTSICISEQNKAQIMQESKFCSDIQMAIPDPIVQENLKMISGPISLEKAILPKRE